MAGLADVVPSIDRPIDYYNSNVNGTLCIANLARQNINLKKIVYAASSSCYGVPKEVPTSENCPIDVRYPYAHSKYVGEDIIMHFAKVYKVPSISMRFFNVFGLRARTTGTYGAVFGTFLAQKLAKEPFTIVGDGNQGRDFIFVTDLVEGMLKAAFSEVHNDIFNIGSGEPHTINELVDLIGGEKIYIPKRPGEPDITHADITKIQKKINWKPKISFKEGVKILSENINNWKDAPVWTPKKIEKATKNWFKHLS
jgi:UDP-glucose 4-epimerase